jgi:hypothetical protein
MTLVHQHVPVFVLPAQPARLTHATPPQLLEALFVLGLEHRVLLVAQLARYQLAILQGAP